MKYVHLIWSALFRRKTRTIFTIVSVIAAFLLFGLLNSVRDAFANAGHNIAGASRMITMSKESLVVSLPTSLEMRIQGVPGVSAVTYANWFGGYYQEAKNQLVTEAVAPNFFDLYPEWVLPAAQLQAFHDTRTGAVVGQSLADHFHWKVGDKIPIQATIFPLKDGSNTWTFDLVGIYHVNDPSLKGEEGAIVFNWDYFDKAAQFGGGTAGWYIERVAQPKDADKVAGAIDAISSNSDHETKTQSEDAFQTSFVSQFADIGLIVGSIMGAVFFTLILLTGNTMAQAVRERIPELAILKTIGFSNRSVLSLVLAESVLLLALGGAIGIFLSGVAVSGIRAKLGPQFPMVPVGANAWLEGIALMVVIGLVVGALPARRGMTLRIVDALSGR
ncbi:MAG TPA: ABC transporter permease [Steroidobacteraceae bacterium]|nr:ABC transporter permease [Steroidobacteraceae bacterium]